MEYAVVTGASSGIGKETTKLLSNQGINVIATARKEEDLKELEQLEKVTAKYLDLTDSSSIEDFGNSFNYHKDKLIGLINNAGVFYMGLTLATPEKQIREMFETNVLGVLHLCKVMLPHLMAAEGRIINISSDSGLAPHPYSIPYSMTKYALEALTDGLARELKDYNVEVCAIEPGNIATSIMNKAMDAVPAPQLVSDLLRHQHKKLISEWEKATYEFSKTRHPQNIAEAIYNCLTSKKVCLRYFNGTKGELEFAVDSLMERIIQINNHNPEQFSIFELLERLKWAYDQKC